MDNSIHIPALNNLISHLKSFADREVLKGIWGVIDLSKGNAEDTYRTNDEVAKWKTYTISITESRVEEARLELNQIINMSSPIQLEDLVKLVTDARKDVAGLLKRENIYDCIDSYNRAPDKKVVWTYVEDDKDSEDYVEGWGGEYLCSISDENYILNSEYVDDYMESIVELFVLPEFNSLTDRVFRLFKVSQMRDDLFGDNNFDSKIRSHDKFDKVVEELVQRKFLRIDEAELFWNGIDRSNLASAAALARYLEKSNIVSYFGSMSNTREVYRTKFNITQKEPNEWNKIYRPASKDGLEFYEDDKGVNDASNYWDQLGFIFDIE